MGQKANPIGLRVGIIKSRLSEWQAQGQRQNASFLVEDLEIRKLVESYYQRAGIAKIVIRKTAKEGEILIFASKLGAIM